MNLIGDKWLPVVFTDGRQDLVGLKELYEKSQEVRDLVLNPPQRISVMRFLICITQAALDGPKDEEDWLNCESRIIPESLKYLDERKDKFDLYGDKPFLQVKNLKTNK
ncbi:MAG: type I-E CRISPR-associated protein Cse1/CasA, partial [Lentisphaerae bacterium]|nr:type I-E CRISPR-associated protein Cse1/CasA [Lentisphaerota bacterium]